MTPDCRGTASKSDGPAVASCRAVPDIRRSFGDQGRMEPRTTTTVAMIGAPWCEGQNLDGVDLAPTALRDAGIAKAIEALNLEFCDAGDVDFSQVTPGTSPHRYTASLYRQWQSESPTDNFATWVNNRRTSTSHQNLHALGSGKKRSYEDALHELNRQDAESKVNVVNAEVMGAGLHVIHEKVKATLGSMTPSPFVLTVGGDHSIASATISALAAQHPRLGVIWVDAHADANTPRSSPSGHYHGMPAAHLLGWFDKPGELGRDAKPADLRGFEWFRPCIAENKLAYIGLRDVDAEEGRMLRRSGVRVFTMRDVDKYGIARVVEMAIEAVGPDMDCPLHLSLDIDSVDPFFAPGTGTVARGGLNYREIHYICEECALSRRLVSLDLVEVNPALDPAMPPRSMHGDNPDIITATPPTVRLAIELILSALGKQIC